MPSIEGSTTGVVTPTLGSTLGEAEGSTLGIKEGSTLGAVEGSTLGVKEGATLSSTLVEGVTLGVAGDLLHAAKERSKQHAKSA
jgi:hypothetical protein